MRAAAYVRVSTAEQVDGYSLDAQERAIRDACVDRGFELVESYRDEGVSARSDRIEKRPALARLLVDAKRGRFDVVIVHSLDRWARNLLVALQSVSKLGEANVGFVSLTESADYSTPQGRFALQILAAMAEYFSGNLGNHVRKARKERFELGLSNGSPPFGYRTCRCVDRLSKGHGSSCAGVVIVEEEAAALKAVAIRYASGLLTFGRAAAQLNEGGFRTRKGALFTSSSVRFLLQNPFLTGRVTLEDSVTKQTAVKPGLHEAIITTSTFDNIMGRKGVREGTKRPNHTYLLKGIICCVHCGLQLWSERHHSGHALYRHRPRAGSDSCPAVGRSIRTVRVDQQVDDLVRSLRLPEDWRSGLERRIASYDRIRTVEQSRAALTDKLRRINVMFKLGNMADDDYAREEREIKSALAELRIPEVEDALAAGELLSSLGEMWSRASLSERHQALRTIVLRTYVDALTGRFVGVTPRPAFWTAFEEVRSENPQVLLLKPDEVKQRLAEQQAAAVELVETGEYPALRTPPAIRIYERPPFAVVIGDFEPLSKVRSKR